MPTKLLILSLFCVFAYFNVFAQEKEKKKFEHREGVLIPISFHFHLPAADMADRFGSNAAVGGALQYKFLSNWILGVDGFYIFGNNVADTTVGQSLLNSDGYYTGTDGGPVPLTFQERGYNLSLSLSKLLPFKSRNPNSGLLVGAGIGYIQHKIKITDNEEAMPQVNGDYVKGYDRLSSGFSIKEEIGFLNLSPNKRVNYYIGLEFIQGFTQNRRLYNFDLKTTETGNRLDFLIGLKIAWILPIYTASDSEYYFD